MSKNICKYWPNSKLLLLIISFLLNCNYVVKAQILTTNNQNKTKICYHELDEQIEATINQQKTIKSTWGILVKELDSDKIF